MQSAILIKVITFKMFTMAITSNVLNLQNVLDHFLPCSSPRLVDRQQPLPVPQQKSDDEDNDHGDQVPHPIFLQMFLRCIYEYVDLMSQIGEEG